MPVFERTNRQKAPYSLIFHLVHRNLDPPYIKKAAWWS